MKDIGRLNTTICSKLLDAIESTAENELSEVQQDELRERTKGISQAISQPDSKILFENPLVCGRKRM